MGKEAFFPPSRLNCFSLSLSLDAQSQIVSPSFLPYTGVGQNGGEAHLGGQTPPPLLPSSFFLSGHPTPPRPGYTVRSESPFLRCVVYLLLRQEAQESDSCTLLVLLLSHVDGNFKSVSV